ncbi:MAG TPA: dihydrofolate reductase family protein [Candidatus Dormibacteraeota bacterium]
MHVIWYTAMSMDGRIADSRDSLDFLDTIGTADESGDDFGTFLAGIDAVIVGASTLRGRLRGGHGWPHGDLPTWLVTHDESLLAAASGGAAPVRRVSGALEPVFAEIEAAGCANVWLAGGGSIAGQALALDRIDEVVVTVAPVAVGAGPSLFDAAGLPPRRFRLVECRAAGGDAVYLRWLRDR